MARDPKSKGLTERERKDILEKGIPFVMGCDLYSNPDGAAYDVLMGKDIFE